MCNRDFPGVDADYARLTAGETLISRNATFTIDRHSDRKSLANCYIPRKMQRFAKCENVFLLAGFLRRENVPRQLIDPADALMKSRFIREMTSMLISFGHAS